MQKSPDNSGEIDLRAFTDPLRGQRKLILRWTLISAGVVLIGTLVVPPRWKADATILTVLPSDLGGSAGASLASALSPNAPDPMQVLEGVLTSRSVVTHIMKQTGLPRRAVEKGLQTERKQKQALLVVSWEDWDRAKALKVVRGALDGVTELQKKILFTTAGIQAQYLEESVHEQEGKLERAEQDLAEYEKHMKAPISPTDPMSAGTYLKERLDLQLQLGTVEASIKIARQQAKLIPTMPDLPTGIKSFGDFRTKLVSLEYGLHVLETTLGPDAPKVVAAKREIEVTKSTLNQEIARYLKSVDVNLDPAIATLEANKMTLQYQLAIVNELATAAPEEAVIVAQKAREVTILGTVSTTLRAKYEEAKVASKVDQVKWALVEEPYIEDLPVNKRYARNPAIGGVLGFLFCAGMLNVKARRKAKRSAGQSSDGTAS